MARLGYDRYGVHGGDVGAGVRKLVPVPEGTHWTEFDHALHFATKEVVADLRTFFAPLR